MVSLITTEAYKQFETFSENKATAFVVARRLFSTYFGASMRCFVNSLEKMLSINITSVVNQIVFLKRSCIVT